MTNAELFKKVFGIYAEEFWAYPEEKMLDWIASDAPTTDVPDRKVGKWMFLKADGSVTSTAVHLYPVCSECGCEHPVASYCPNCGAEMLEGV